MRFRSIVAWSAAVVAPLSAQQVELHAAVPAAGLAWGEPFELTLRVRWPEAADLAPVDVRQFAPLQVEPAASPVADAGERVLRYRARALATGDLSIGPVEVRTASGTGRARSAPLPLRVRSSLPEPAGPVEWPGDVRDPASAAWWWPTVVVSLSGFAIAMWYWRSPRHRRAPAGAATGPDLAQALAALPLPAEPAAVPGFYRDVKALLRAHATQCHGLRAEVATSEELLQRLPPRPALARCLAGCDGVLFAAAAPAGDDHAAVRAAAIEWVRGDRGGAA